MSLKATSAAPAHAEVPDEKYGEAFNASSSGRYRTSTLRGMLDTGCYPCMRRTTDGLSNQAKVNIQVRVAKQGVGSVANICGRVVIDGRTPMSTGQGGLRTLVLPDFEHDLWSVYEIARAGYTAVFDFDRARIFHNDAIHIQGTPAVEEQVDHSRRQYYMTLPVKTFIPEYDESNGDAAIANVASAIHKLSDADLVHGRCGHIGAEYMKRATQDTKYKIPNTPHGCADCSRAKGTSHKHNRIKPEERIPKKPGEYIVSDICGPFRAMKASDMRKYSSMKHRSTSG